MIETPLSRQLSATASRPDARLAFLTARRWFIAGRRLEMQELAAQVGVSRATVFRWVGNREELLADVVWSVTEPTIATAAEQARGRGAQRIAAILRDISAAANTAPYFRQFLQREPERALRILTTRSGSMQRRVIAAIEELVQAEVDDGRLVPPLPVPDLAYLLVRMSEAFIYTDTITGDPPDAAKVEQATIALLT